MLIKDPGAQQYLSNVDLAVLYAFCLVIVRPTCMQHCRCCQAPY